MNIKNLHLFTFLLLIFSPTFLKAQTLQVNGLSLNSYIIPAADTVTMGFNSDFITIPVAKNCDYNVTVNDEWLKAKKEVNGNITLFSGYHFGSSDRYGTATITSADGNVTRTLTVKQNANNLSGAIVNDTKLTGITATDNGHQNGEDVSRTLDGNVNTLYHSSYNNTTFPIILTYTLATASHIDYVIYTPRQDNNTNGNFQEVKIELKKGTSAEWSELKTINLGGTSSATRITFGEEGVDDVKGVRFTVKSGVSGWVSCAEMGFYQQDRSLEEELDRYFVDKLYTELKEGITQTDVSKIKTPIVKKFVYTMLQGNYEKKFRVNEFRPYKPIWDLRNELKTQYAYNNHENPTGITFRQGETVAIIVEGLEDDPLALQIRNFGPTEFSTSTYALTNGINVISCQHKGNGYINYYTTNYETAPKVKIHFFNATVNGYFDLMAGDTNADWNRMLNAASGDCFDFKGQYLNGTFPVATLLENCPNDGVWLSQTYDDIVKLEHHVMGLDKYDREHGNTQTVITVATSGGLYHASNDGFCVPVNALRDPSSRTHFDFWGAAHELGHVNQTTGVLWIGLTEVTNNIFSAFIEHKLRSNGYHRLENESNGFRFYDYYDYQVLADPYIPTNDSEKPRGYFLPSTNKDVFITLIPLWQLLVYTHEAGINPDAYPDLFETMRTMSSVNSMDDGQKQVNFMRQWCLINQTNYLPFFKQARMFAPIDQMIGDYSNRQLTITQAMLDNLEQEILGKGFPEAPAGLVFINIYNKDAFANKVTVPSGITPNTGCTKNTDYIRIQHASWPNVVGFETYNEDGKLIHMTNYGRGFSGNNYVPTYTDVVWKAAERPSYIMAVSYDGSKVKCYQK